MAPPRLRIVGNRNDHAKRLQGDISSLLTSVLKTEPDLSPQQAMWKVQEQLLKNNPYEPPKDGKCIINELPPKVLARIFRFGVQLQREGDDEYEYDESDDDDDDEDEIKTSRLLENDPSVEDDDGASDWEDDADEVEDSDGEEKEKETPLEILVSHVCRSWRDIAINTLDLWTTLFISAPHQWAVYDLYLERAQTEALALDISIGGVGDAAPGPTKRDTGRDAAASTQEIKDIMGRLVPKASQWRSLFISTNFWSDAKEILRILHQVPAAPFLEVLQFHCSDDIADYDKFTPAEQKEPFYLPFQGNAPKLEAVNLLSVHIDWDGAVSMFKDLKEVELGYHAKDVLPSWQAFSTYIKNSPGLFRLELKSSGPALPGHLGGALTDSEDHFRIPSVRSLVLCDHEPVYALGLVEKLHFPNLRYLLLDYEGGDYTEVVEALSKPAQGEHGLFQIIDTFDLHGLGHIDDKAVQPMLKALSGLKNLTLNCGNEVGGHRSVRKAWDALAAVTSDLLLPGLEGIRTHNISGNQLRKFLSRRIAIGAPLKVLSVHPDDDIAEGDEKWFRENLEEFEYYIDSEEEEDSEDGREAAQTTNRLAQRRLRGAASSRITTGLSNLD